MLQATMPLGSTLKGVERVLKVAREGVEVGDMAVVPSLLDFPSVLATPSGAGAPKMARRIKFSVTNNRCVFSPFCSPLNIHTCVCRGFRILECLCSCPDGELPELQPEPFPP